jgi:hypothetical protein
MPASLTLSLKRVWTFDALKCSDSLACSDQMPCTDTGSATNPVGTLTLTPRS